MRNRANLCLMRIVAEYTFYCIGNLFRVVTAAFRVTQYFPNSFCFRPWNGAKLSFGKFSLQCSLNFFILFCLEREYEFHLTRRKDLQKDWKSLIESVLRLIFVASIIKQYSSILLKWVRGKCLNLFCKYVDAENSRKNLKLTNYS